MFGGLEMQPPRIHVLIVFSAEHGLSEESLSAECMEQLESGAISRRGSRV